MTQDDQYRYYENYKWFNQFFGDLLQLFQSIHSALKSDLSYKIENHNWYYEKSNHVPKIPPYWVNGISESGFALQIFAVLDPMILEKQPAFDNTLSLIFVKHARSDKPLWINEYGLKVLYKNIQITQRSDHGRYISGEINNGDDRTPYHAFQVPLSVFTSGNDIQKAIHDEVVDILREIPGWE